MQVVSKQETTNNMSGGGTHDYHDDVYEEVVRSIVSRNAVVVFAVSGCCMCHVVKRLLIGLGVGPVTVELDGDVGRMYAVLSRIGGVGGMKWLAVPAVFVGGRFLGGIEAVMTSHINGMLVPLLKDAGALWL